jgi:hypothetical protein
MASPLYIEIGLHYYARTTDFRNGDFSAPAVRDAVKSFVEYGMLKPADGTGTKYEATEALNVWVRALCAVNWPVQRWVIEAHPRAALTQDRAGEWEGYLGD